MDTRTITNIPASNVIPMHWLSTFDLRHIRDRISWHIEAGSYVLPTELALWIKLNTEIARREHYNGGISRTMRRRLDDWTKVEV